MKQEAKDRGLRKALNTKSNALPSNFTFCTMQKIEEHIRNKEKRAEQRIFYSIVAVSSIMLVALGVFFEYFYGKELIRAFSYIADTFMQIEIFASPYIYLAMIFFILICFDHWMRRSYFKRHKSKE